MTAAQLAGLKQKLGPQFIPQGQGIQITFLPTPGGVAFLAATPTSTGVLLSTQGSFKNEDPEPDPQNPGFIDKIKNWLRDVKDWLKYGDYPKTAAKDNPVETLKEDTVFSRYGKKNDDKVNNDGSVEPNTYATPVKDLAPEELGKIDSPQQGIDGKRYIFAKKGTKVQRGTVPGRENGGSGGAPEVIFVDGLPSNSAGDFQSF